MKKDFIRKIVSVLVILVMSTAFAAAGYGQESSMMADDERFEEAYKSYEKGLRDEKRGDRAFRVRPGEAQRRYEHAEHYYTTSIFLYQEIGSKYDINVKKEVDIIDKKFRGVHVKTGNARRKADKK